jgi:hypothetical protein
VIPALTRIETTAERGTYRIWLTAPSGEVSEALMRVSNSSESTVAVPEPDVFRHWSGDAESVRRVVAAVFAVHAAQGDDRP